MPEFSESDEPTIANLRAARDWLNYDRWLREVNRFVVGNENYFRCLVDDCLACRRTLDQGSEVFRARIMPVERETDEEPLSLWDMRAPPTTFAGSGRLNPEGILCFYAALEVETAVAEVRPWPTALVSVARFVTNMPIKVVDLTGAPDLSLSPTAAFAAHMISCPVHRDDRLAYVSTQYLAETLKAKGVEGIFYKSLLNSEGTNVAFFSEHGLAGVAVALRTVTSVSYHCIELAPWRAGAS